MQWAMEDYKYWKSNQLISLKISVMIGFIVQRIDRLQFGGNPVMDTDSGLLVHFLHHCKIGYFRRFIGIFSHSHRPLFTKFGELTDADKGMNPH